MSIKYDKIKKSMKNAKNFLEKNKDTIKFCSTMAIFVGTGVLVHFIAKDPTNGKILKMEPIEYKSFDAPDLKTADWVEKPWYEGCCTQMIVQNLKLSDVGEFGKELMDLFENTSEDEKIDLIIGMAGEKHPKK